MRDKRWWLLLIALGLVRGLLYSALIPPWQGPDEPQHYEYVRLLREKGRLLQWGDSTPTVEQEVIASMGQFDYWRTGRYVYPGSTFNEIWDGYAHDLQQPPLAYLLYLGALLIAPDDVALQLYLMRLLSVLLSLIVIIAALEVASMLWPAHSSLRWAIPAFIVFLPTYMAMGGMVNNDHLAEVAVSLVLASWVVAFKQGLSIPLVGALIMLSPIGLLAKRTAIILLPLHVIAAVIYLWLHHRRVLSGKNVILALLASGLALSIIFWTGNSGLTWLSKHRPIIAEWLLKIYLFLPSKNFPLSLDHPYLSSEALQLYAHYARFLFETFWGRFALLQVCWPPALYILAGLLSLLALTGLVLFARRVVTRTYSLQDWQLATFLLFAFSAAVMVILIYANEIRRWDIEWGGWPQGRYLFPTIVPIATLFVLGWSELVPPRHRRMWVTALIGILIGLDTFSMTSLIIPYFYG